MLEKLIGFTEFLIKFQKIERVLYVKGLDRNENDAEHSYQLALTGWYINSVGKLGMDSEKIIKYALVHDLVEVYAGDVFFHITSEDVQNKKEEAELKALEQIKNEFSDFPELYEGIHEYEKKNDKESLFIYSLDKLLPVLNIHLDGGRSWKRDGVTMEMIRSKTLKISKDENVLAVWEELLDLIEESGSI